MDKRRATSLPSATGYGKVMFLHVSVILSTRRWGMAGRHPILGRHPHPETASAADGTHPTGMHSCQASISTLVK